MTGELGPLAANNRYSLTTQISREDNPVRAVDAFVDMLDLCTLGFTVAKPRLGGPPITSPCS